MKRRSLLQSIAVALFAPLASLATPVSAPMVADEDTAFLCGVASGYREQSAGSSPEYRRSWERSNLDHEAFDPQGSDESYAARVLADKGEHHPSLTRKPRVL